MPRTGVKYTRGSNLSAGEQATGMAYLPDFTFKAVGFEAGDVFFAATDVRYENPTCWADGSGPESTTPRFIEGADARRLIREHWEAFLELQTAVEGYFAGVEGSTLVPLSRPAWAEPGYSEPDPQPES